MTASSGFSGVSDFWRDVATDNQPVNGSQQGDGVWHNREIHVGNANISDLTRFEHLGIVSYTGNGSFASQVIQTNIPKDSYIMPTIRLSGYCYGSADTVDMQIGLYAYGLSGAILNAVWQSKGTRSPVQVRAGWNASNLLALEITWPAAEYFNRYAINAYCDGNVGTQRDSWFANWVISNTIFTTETQVVVLTNKALPIAANALPFATPAQTIAGTATGMIVNPADLFARENIAAQTGLGLVLSALPAPTAAQSPWGVNALNEVLHYTPGVGWQVVAGRYGTEIIQVGSVATVANIWKTAVSLTMPRAGRIVATGRVHTLNSAYYAGAGGIALNGIVKKANNSARVGGVGTVSSSIPYEIAEHNAQLAWTGNVAAGDVLALQAITLASAGTADSGSLDYTYL